jgi:uncharacterized protein YihD (DUF1040 family)
MKLESYKNNYSHKVVDCPFCKKVIYVRDSTKITPDPLRDLKRHITNQAKNEAFNTFLAEVKDNHLFPHLRYYKEHTIEKAVVVPSSKREYDNDLKLND